MASTVMTLDDKLDHAYSRTPVQPQFQVYSSHQGFIQKSAYTAGSIMPGVLTALIFPGRWIPFIGGYIASRLIKYKNKSIAERTGDAAASIFK